MSRIELVGVSKRFGDVQALDQVDLDVPDGSFFVLLGPSGAGKTTTLRVIAGLERPDSGEVRFDGTPAARATPAERDVAMVFQNYALYPKHTVFENIASPLRARRYPAERIKEEVERTAELLHITRLLGRRPSQLSGGEQQRVALARALVRTPRAYLMDEPLTNLDLKLRVEMRTELTRLHRHFQRTFLYVTNDQVEAMSMADRIAVLDRGRVQQVGTPEEVYNRPVNRFVATFIGSPRMNLLPCAREDGQLRGEGGWSIPAPEWARAEPGRKLLMGVRPEDLSVDGAAAGGGQEGWPELAGRVYAVEPLGDRSLVDVEVGAAVVKVKARPTASFKVGEPVRLGVNLGRVHLFDAETERALER